MEKLKILRVVHSDPENDLCILSDDGLRVRVHMDGSSLAIPGQMWLVDVENRVLLFECPKGEVDIHVDGKYFRVAYGKESKEIGMDDRKEFSGEGAKRENVGDLSEVEEILDRDISFESRHVLESGTAVSIRAKISGRSLHRYCPELDLIDVSPLTSKILKSLVSKEGLVYYSAGRNEIAFGNGTVVQITEGEEIEIFEDLVIDAWRSAESKVVGRMKSSFFGNMPEVVVGTHTGSYSVDPSSSNIIYPDVEYQVPAHLRNRVRFHFEPVPYEVFRECVEKYVASHRHLGEERLKEYISMDYVNFGGTPIALSLEDRIHLLEKYVMRTPEAERDLQRKI